MRFSVGYLEGYFETATSKEFGIWFIDYNRILGKMFQDFAVKRVDLGKYNRDYPFRSLGLLMSHRLLWFYLKHNLFSF